MAELNIRERQAGDVTILDLEGKITIGEGNVALRSAVRRLVQEGKKKVLLNLSGVSYMDSSGIGELVSSHTTISREQGQLKMLGLGEKMSRPAYGVAAYLQRAGYRIIPVHPNASAVLATPVACAP